MMLLWIVPFVFHVAKVPGKVKRGTGLADQAFLIKGFTNWKDATRGYSKYEASDFHKQAIDAMSNKADVVEMLSSQLV